MTRGLKQVIGTCRAMVAKHACVARMDVFRAAVVSELAAVVHVGLAVAASLRTHVQTLGEHRTSEPTACACHDQMQGAPQGFLELCLSFGTVGIGGLGKQALARSDNGQDSARASAHRV